MKTPYYQKHLSDSPRMKTYLAYQRKYFSKLRDSDREMIRILKMKRVGKQTSKSLLDIGCSSGGLLFHLQNYFPSMKLAGIDISPRAIESCKSNPALRNISFRTLDLLQLSHGSLGNFDFAVTNASLPLFSPKEFPRAVKSIASSLRQNGLWIGFDWFHPFEQELEICERTRLFPHGLIFHFRGYETVQRACRRAGFSSVTFHPFNISIDLPRPPYREVTSYTIKEMHRKRMSFRGTLFQPWCFIVARKK